jgi:Zn finger protein HypA/HybF involved in hydrogenase expression
VMLSTSGAEVCSQCREDAIKYFQTGQIETKCPKCGATRTPVVINTNVGHQ